MNDTKYNFDDADETAEITTDVRELPSLDDDPVTNESGFRISDEIFRIGRNDFVDEFENLVDMAGG